MATYYATESRLVVLLLMATQVLLSLVARITAAVAAFECLRRHEKGQRSRRLEDLY